MALLHGLSMAFDKDFMNLICYTEPLQVMQGISTSHHYAPIVGDVKKLLYPGNGQLNKSIL